MTLPAFQQSGGKRGYGQEFNGAVFVDNLHSCQGNASGDRRDGERKTHPEKALPSTQAKAARGLQLTAAAKAEVVPCQKNDIGQVGQDENSNAPAQSIDLSALSSS